MEKSIPKWITVVSIPIAALGLFVGGSLYLSPATFIENVDFSTAGTRYLANMWAARQISIAAIIGYSVFRQSAVMLKVALIAYCLMTFQDIFIGVSIGDFVLIIVTSIFCLLSAYMIFVLSRNAGREITR